MATLSASCRILFTFKAPLSTSLFLSLFVAVTGIPFPVVQLRGMASMLTVGEMLVEIVFNSESRTVPSTCGTTRAEPMVTMLLLYWARLILLPPPILPGGLIGTIQYCCWIYLRL